MSVVSPVPLRSIEASPVPADCTTAGLEYMPLMIDRLRGSRAWLRAKRRPELGFYLMNLWSAAWRGHPAGSLEDDDDVLADAAMCSAEVWPEVRSMVLAGWLRCAADGRLYHPVVCQLASDVWATRTAYRASMARARAAKSAKRGRDLAGQAKLDLRTPRGGEGTRSDSSADQFVDAANMVPAAAEEQSNPSADPNEGTAIHLHGQETLPDEPSVTETSHTFKCEVQSEEKGDSPLSPRSIRGDRIPLDFVPDNDSVWTVTRLGLDVNEALEAFMDRYRSCSTRSLDWQARFRTDCRAARRNDRSAPAGRPGKFSDAHVAESLRNLIDKCGPDAVAGFLGVTPDLRAAA